VFTFAAPPPPDEEEDAIQPPPLNLLSAPPPPPDDDDEEEEEDENAIQPPPLNLLSAPPPPPDEEEDAIEPPLLNLLSAPPLPSDEEEDTATPRPSPSHVAPVQLNLPSAPIFTSTAPPPSEEEETPGPPSRAAVPLQFLRESHAPAAASSLAETANQGVRIALPQAGGGEENAPETPLNAGAQLAAPTRVHTPAPAPSAGGRAQAMRIGPPQADGAEEDAAESPIKAGASATAQSLARARRTPGASSRIKGAEEDAPESPIKTGASATAQALTRARGSPSAFSRGKGESSTVSSVEPLETDGAEEDAAESPIKAGAPTTAQSLARARRTPGASSRVKGASSALSSTEPPQVDGADAAPLSAGAPTAAPEPARKRRSPGVAPSVEKPTVKGARLEMSGQASSQEDLPDAPEPGHGARTPAAPAVARPKRRRRPAPGPPRACPAPIDDDYYDDDELTPKKRAALRACHPATPPLLVVEVDSTALGQRTARSPVLPSVAGPLRLPSLRFAPKPRQREGHDIVLNDKLFEIPYRTQMDEWKEITWRPRLKLAVNVADVSLFASAVRRQNIPIVEVIASLELPGLELLYAEEIPLENARPLVTRERPMTHPITRWARPPRIDIHSLQIPTNW
jgi:hypothetical protein